MTGSGSPAAMSVLTDGQVKLLTEARTARWRLEVYEFAYDARVRRLFNNRTILEFLGVLLAIVFLFVQYLFKENETAHSVLSYIGTGLSLVVLLMVVWSHMAQWAGQMEKKRELSAELRAMITGHERLVTARPLDEPAIREWLHECQAIEDRRKHDLATLPGYFLKRGHQHVGNRYQGHGVVCSMCGKEWRPEMNKRTKWSWIPFFGCNNCGV